MTVNIEKMRFDMADTQRQSARDLKKFVITVAAAAGIAGVLGFKLGQREPTTPPTQQIILPPGTTIITPKAPP